MIFVMLRPNEIDVFWERCKEMLLPGLRERIHIHTIQDYYLPLKAGEMQMWVAMKDMVLMGCVVTSVVDGSQCRQLNALSLGGENLKEWVGLMDEGLTSFAKMNNCKAIEAVTRPGFSKLIPGFVQDAVCYVKMIGEEIEQA